MNNTVSDLKVVSFFGIKFRYRHAPLIQSCYWIPPVSDEIKINCDGASSGNPGRGGCGTVFRQGRHKIIGVLVLNLPYTASYQAECNSIIEALAKAQTLRYTKIWIATDSSAAAAAFNSDQLPWRLQAVENTEKMFHQIQDHKCMEGGEFWSRPSGQESCHFTRWHYGMA
ncbi:hypothetical protein GIB67_025869 [Kingdonia uniflora]|uniref:RNase H type-1 domain-containing protein n=1 Tax=Kingdonia uniflora TaxID=39325 RepID=A0A7J7MD93_9MAGN|nr:hypothetical protein GIB67_025869 [Kingdonia uniflora]